MNLRIIQFAIQSLVLICYLTDTNAQFRVINAEDIDIAQAPYSVALFYKNEFHCMGSLVNMNSVVTVAHCVVKRKERKYTLLAGVTDISEINTRRGQERKVKEIHYPREYDRKTSYMDIAVMKVYEPFYQTDRVQSISLCQHAMQKGLDLKISGWGSIDRDSNTPSNRLKTVEMPIIDTWYCKYLYRHITNPKLLGDTIMCAGCTGRDPCYGDSGAAGLFKGQLCAVVKGGSDDERIANIFTDVSHPKVYQYITSKMCI